MNNVKNSMYLYSDFQFTEPVYMLFGSCPQSIVSTVVPALADEETEAQNSTGTCP